MRRWRLWGALSMAALALPASSAPARFKSLAQFDSGYAQCERLYPEMRGHRDEAYAGVYRLKLDDALDKRTEAAHKRSEADRMKELATAEKEKREAEKEKRQAERANGQS